MLPRSYNALAPLAKIPNLSDRVIGFAGTLPMFTRQEFKDMDGLCLKPDRAQEKWQKNTGNIEDELVTSVSHPTPTPVGPAERLSMLSRILPGYAGGDDRYVPLPDKLLAACNKILEERLKRAAPADPKREAIPKRLFHSSAPWCRRFYVQKAV